jgi:CDP-6-deoxy-D-xylo-4-hexulose-3-dehydrase
MNNTFWIGVYPGITEEMLEYVVNCIENFLNKKEAIKIIVGPK